MGDDGIGSCWGRAFRCRTQHTDSHQSTCEAWYRCDGVANYVIRWRCQENQDTPAASLATPTAASFDPSHPLTCDNSTAIDTDACPPPVVCPGTMSGDGHTIVVTKDDVIDLDIILAVVLALVALLIIALVIVASCKYWTARRRYRRRFPSKYRQFRSFTPATNYPGWWVLGESPKHVTQFIGKSGSMEGIPYTDVYVPHPAYVHDTRDPKYWSIYRSGKNSKKGKRAGKVFGDRSVLTGSFVYQPNMLQSSDMRITNVERNPKSTSTRRDKRHQDGSARHWRHGVHKSDSKNTKKITSLSQFWHSDENALYAKGGNNENSTRPFDYFVRPPTPDYSMDASSKHHHQAAKISSIHIPSYDNHIDGRSNVHIPHNSKSNKYPLHGNGAFNFRHVFQPTPSHYGHPHDSSHSSSNVTHDEPNHHHFRDGISESASVASKNWEYTVFSRVDNVNIRSSEIVSSVKPLQNDHQQPPNSPDVISSHNLSRHVSYIAHDNHMTSDSRDGNSVIREESLAGDTNEIIARDLVARITVPNYQSPNFISSDISEARTRFTNAQSEHTNKINIPDHFINDSTCSSVVSPNNTMHRELSYDSFRNEHLRQLARQELVASSSTLDKGTGRVHATNLTSMNYRY